jgi:hypothetical protein
MNPATNTIETSQEEFNAATSSLLVFPCLPRSKVKHNGYVIAAGGIHSSGAVYEIIDARSPVPVPVTLERLIRKSPIDERKSR